MEEETAVAVSWPSGGWRQAGTGGVRAASVACLCCAILAGAAWARDGGRFESTVTNAADPFVFQDGDAGYFLFTTNAKGRNVPTYRSSDLSTWSRVGDVMPQLAPWAEKGATWAPEVLKVDSTYALFYAARKRGKRGHCVGVAFSDQVTGPYLDHAEQPLVCQDAIGGAIDPSPFRDSDGQLYLTWKNDGNALRQRTWIWISALTPDAAALVGDVKPLLVNSEPWEGRCIEAPSLEKRGDKYYLFYSGSMFNTRRYAVGYASSDSVFGPFEKHADNPILRTTGDLVAPGHQDVFVDKDGHYWIAFHAYPGRIKGTKRYTRIQRLDWDDGVPRVRLDLAR